MHGPVNHIYKSKNRHAKPIKEMLNEPKPIEEFIDYITRCRWATMSHRQKTQDYICTKTEIASCLDTQRTQKGKNEGLNLK